MKNYLLFFIEFSFEISCFCNCLSLDEVKLNCDMERRSTQIFGFSKDVEEETNCVSTSFSSTIVGVLFDECIGLEEMN